MALTQRQTALYRDTVDIYTIATSASLPLGEGDVPAYNASPTYSSVKCKLFSTSETAGPETQGRSRNTRRLFGDDVFHFECSVNLKDTYLIKLTTAGHPLLGKYWVVVGNPSQRPAQGNRNANVQKAYAKRTPKPGGVS